MSGTLSTAGEGPTQQDRSALRRLAVHGSAWLLGGQLGNLGLRLTSSLVLTRMLSPELFGLIALAQLMNRGVTMFADVGLRGNVVHHTRGDEPAFLDTVWSVQVVRGFVLWAVVALLAAPAAAFYDAPVLTALMPVLALGTIFLGFQSTAIYSVMRHVQPRRRVTFDVAVKAIGLVVMIVWAWVSPSVWVLAGGALTAAALQSLSTWFLVPGRRRDRFGWDPQAAREILRFGRWILIATALTYLLVEADKLLLGRLVSAEELGVYTIAALFCTVIVETVSRLSVEVLFPLYAKIARGEGSARSAERLRAGVVGLALPPIWLLALGGPWLIEHLYDPRYHEAGWMAQLLALGAIAQALTLTSERMLLARGNSYLHMWGSLVQTLATLAGVGIGAWQGGVPGLLAGLAVARWAGWAFVQALLLRERLATPRVDAAAIALSTLVLGAGLALGLGPWS